MVARSDYVEGVARALDSRGKGKLDMVEIRKVSGSRCWARDVEIHNVLMF
jgi:hypothetical protein